MASVARARGRVRKVVSNAKVTADVRARALRATSVSEQGQGTHVSVLSVVCSCGVVFKCVRVVLCNRPAHQFFEKLLVGVFVWCFAIVQLISFFLKLLFGRAHELDGCYR
jgi:hypothetical protein